MTKRMSTDWRGRLMGFAGARFLCGGTPGRSLRLLILLLLIVPTALAHGVDEADQAQFAEGGVGVMFYQGAKHMVTGYDHLLFLAGVMFFLYSTKDILVYVSWFTLGHSVTLLFGVLANVQFNAFLVDAVIGLSVVYKAFDNLGGFSGWRHPPNPRKAVLAFGLIHGFGLATKVQELIPRDDTGRLIADLVAFNVGVEAGQLFALVLILLGLLFWRRHAAFERHAVAANTVLMAAGFALFGMQITGYFQ